MSSSDSDCSSSPSVNLCRPPPVAPPEFRRSALFKNPGELDHIDEKVLNVSLVRINTLLRNNSIIQSCSFFSFLLFCFNNQKYVYLQIAKTDYSSFTVLVKSLMQDCTCDLEKARFVACFGITFDT